MNAKNESANDIGSAEKIKKSWWNSIGPGLITGAADDDPSGIATYSQAGAKFGFDMLWTMPFAYPLMAAVQIISARIGNVSGHGLATHIRKLYPPWLGYAIVGALCIANTINIGADIAAMGDAAALLIDADSHWFALGLGALSLLLQIAVPYRRYVKIMKWLTLAVFSYVATAFVQTIDWPRVFKHLIFPDWRWRGDYITTLVAIFGTTISPYLFFWQSSEEVEELHKQHIAPAMRVRDAAKNQQRFRAIDNDTLFGMAVSNIVGFFIILSTALALHAHGITHIETSAQAARALQPIAGDTAFLLFTLGIIGTGMLAVPVLAGSCAYAVSGIFKWKASLEHSFFEARKFYGVIVITVVTGIALCFAPINPIDALYWSAVINGVVAVPVIAIMLRMATDARVMGQYRIGRVLQCLGWITMAIMGAIAIAMFVF